MLACGQDGGCTTPPSCVHPANALMQSVGNRCPSQLPFSQSQWYCLQVDGHRVQLGRAAMQSKAPGTQDPNFAIIRALCRAALQTPNEAVSQQVRRLREAYVRAGAIAEADALDRLLGQSQADADFAPSRLTRSRQQLSGEELTPRTPVPVDRETSTPLVEIIFPDRLPERAPMFDDDIDAAVRTVLSEWAYWDALKAMAIEPTHTCLIYGPPGTGKTQLALWMAGQLGLPIVLARLDGLVSSFLGTTSRNIGALFQFANRYQCVLLLDEFDALAKMRDDPQEIGEIKRVVNTLLQNLDARRGGGITIGITNHDKMLDQAVWRRFDVQLGMPLPNTATRLQIARFYLQPMTTSDAQLKLVAWLGEGLSGAEIETLARALKKAAAIDGERFDFVTAVRRLSSLHAGRLSVDRRDALRQENPQLASTLLDDRSLHFEQKEIAQLFGRDPGTISRWMKDRAAVRLS